MVRNDITAVAMGYLAGERMTGSCTGADAAKRETILSKVLVNFICILNPEKIVLGGEITEKMTQHIKEQCC